MKRFRDRTAEPNGRSFERWCVSPQVAALIGVVFFVAGCGESKPAAAPQPAAQHAEKGTDKPESRPTPVDETLLAPRPDLDQALAIYAVSRERERSRLLRAFSLDGGTPVLHAMIYLDYSLTEAPVGKPKDYREIRAYHLLPWLPGITKEEVRLSDINRVDDYRFRPERICIFDARREGLCISSGAVAKWSQFPPSPSSGEVDSRAWSRGLPYELESEYVVVSAERIKDGFHPMAYYSVPRSSSSFGAAIRQIPATIEMKETLSFLTYDDFGSTKASVSIECLPIPNPISIGDLLSLAEKWRKEAAGDPQSVAPRYYFAWAALFGAQRTADEPRRRQLLIDAEASLGEACALAPDDQAFVALRRLLLVERIRSSFGKDRDGILQAAERLMTLHPTSDDCYTAVDGLRRFALGSDPPLDAVAIRLIRRRLDWYFDWTAELKVDLDYWKKQRAQGNLLLLGLDPVLAEYQAKLPASPK